MGFYRDRILPHLIGCACQVDPIMQQRARIIPRARGIVLDVGFGNGPNLAFYDRARVDHLLALEPSAGMRRKVGARLAASDLPHGLLDAPAEAIPLPDDSIDTVVLTYTLCSIPDYAAALAEMRRVLRPDGQLLFCEHGLAPDPGLARWQKRIEPVWKRVSGGCHLTRPADRLIDAAGFELSEISRDYIPASLKIVAFDYLGVARPR